MESDDAFSNPGLKDPTLLVRFWLHLGQKLTNALINVGIDRLSLED